MPAITVTDTAGSASANTFVSVADADAYLNTRLNASAWNSETDADQKARALIEATRELNLLHYIGSRVTTTQALAWPRQYARDPDKPDIIYVGNIALMYFDSATVPQRIKDATCELALEFLRSGTTDIAQIDPALAIEEETIDVITTRYYQQAYRSQGLARFARVMLKLDQLLDESGSGLELARA